MAPQTSPTEVGPRRSFHLVVWLGFPLAGALAGALLAWGLDWVLGLSWAPMQGPLELVDELTGRWTLEVLVALGVVLGLVIAVLTHREVARIRVSDEEVSVQQEGHERRVPALEVAAVFPEWGRLVLQDVAGRRLVWARLEDLAPEQVRAAFVSHGYPWVAADPYDAEFRRWVPGAPALPVGADEVLVARQKALETNNGQDAEEFRLELQKLGVVVRDEGDRQYWRPTS